MNNDSFLNNFNFSRNNTPNNKSGRGTPYNLSLELSNGYNNESNKIQLSNIKDENELRKRFKVQESEIKNYSLYYKSLEEVFDRCDIELKNHLLLYVFEFNNNCKRYVNERTNQIMAAKKNSNEKNRLREELNQQKDYSNNMELKYKKDIEELKEKYQKEIDNYKFKLNKAEDQIKNLTKSIEKLNQEINKKEKQILDLREDFSKSNDPSCQDFMIISYPLGDTSKTSNDLKLDFPLRQDFNNNPFKEKLEKSEKNFNVYVNLLVETSNKALEYYKKIYFKMKGKELIESNNLIKMYNVPTYNICEELSWTNIMNIHRTINEILKEIFELVNPSRDCDPKRLNEDSCDFLLNYIIGLRKLFFLQKEILDNSFHYENNIENKKDNFMQFKKITQETEEFFEENDVILNNQDYFEKFNKELKEDNTKTLSVDQYMKTLKSVLTQAKKISDKNENIINEYLHELNTQNNRNTVDDVVASNSKNEKF